MDDNENNARELEIQWTREYAQQNSYEDEESLDEESISDVDWQIGESREVIEINSFDDIPEGYEPVNPTEAEEFDEWKNSQDYLSDDDFDEGIDFEDEDDYE